jgi:hypothetical protein
MKRTEAEIAKVLAKAGPRPQAVFSAYPEAESVI